MSTKSGKAAPPGCYWRNGILWGRVQVRGAEIRFSLRTRDVRIAAKRYDARRALELGAGHFGEIRRSYDDVFNAWAQWLPDQVKSDQTVRRYAMSLKQLGPHLRPLYLDQINAAKVSEIVAIRRKTITIATVRRDLTALSSLLGFCEAQNWSEGNAALAWLRRLRERRDPIELPIEADFERVCARAPGMLEALLRALRATGCRLEELNFAKRAQLDEKKKQLTVIGKGNELRVIDLEPFGGFAIFDALPVYLAEPWLFWHDEGLPYRNLSSRLAALVSAEHKAAIEAAGEDRTPDFRPFRIHDLRHWHAVEWLQSGRNIYDLQGRLGHKSVKTTEIYLKYLTPEQARRVKYGSAT